MRESAEHGADVGESESQCWPGLWRRQADTHGTIFTTRERGGAQVQVESIAQFSVLGPDLPAKPCSVIIRGMGLGSREFIVIRCVLNSVKVFSVVCGCHEKCHL